jgi:acyl dehydratase
MLDHFEDLHIGQRFRAGPIVLTRERIIEFGIEFDPQPMHVSDEAAIDTLAGELIASGWHTGAVTMRLLIDGAMPRWQGKGIGAGISSLKWPNPVRPGDALSAESEILDLRRSKSNPWRGIMTIRTITTNQRDDVVQEVIANMIAPCRTDGS